MSNVYSFALRPEEHQPSGTINFSKIDDVCFVGSNIKREKNKFYFDDFYDDDVVEHKRKYQNDWSELREFVGLDDIELTDNELVIVNMKGLKERQSKIKIYSTNYNVLRIMSGMGGLAYST